MRLIDADKLHPDRMTNKGTVAISQSQIANAKTIEAIPLSVIEKIKTYIHKNVMFRDLWHGEKDLMDYIDKAVEEGLLEEKETQRPYKEYQDLRTGELVREYKENENDKPRKV